MCNRYPSFFLKRYEDFIYFFKLAVKPQKKIISFNTTFYISDRFCIFKPASLKVWWNVFMSEAACLSPSSPTATPTWRWGSSQISHEPKAPNHSDRHTLLLRHQTCKDTPAKTSHTYALSRLDATRECRLKIMSRTNVTSSSTVSAGQCKRTSEQNSCSVFVGI